MGELHFTENQPSFDGGVDELGIPRTIRPEAVERVLELHARLTKAGVYSYDDAGHPAAKNFLDGLDRLTPDERSEVHNRLNPGITFDQSAQQRVEG